MSDHKARYKQKGLGFGDVEKSRISRAEARDERRKEIRAVNFSKLRPLAEATLKQTPGKSAPSTPRNEKLIKWKQQKEMKKKIETKVKKPPFKVGVVHHRLLSPPLNNVIVPSCSQSNSHTNVKSRVQSQTIPVKRITRVTEKRLAAKAAAKAAASQAAKKSFAPPNYKFKAPIGVQNIPLFGRIKKGSMDATKFNFQFNDKSTIIKSEPRTSLTSLRKKSSSSTVESPRRSKKYKVSPKQDEVATLNTEMKIDTSLSSTRRSQVSDSSIDSISLRISSDDPEVFEPPDAESSCVNLETQNKESSLKEMLLPVAQPEKMNHTLSPIDMEKSPRKLRVSFRESGNDFHLSLLSESKINSSQSRKRLSLNLIEADSLEKDETPEISLKTKSEKMNTTSSESAEKSLNDSQNVAFFSPYVVTKRGKKEARKEQQFRRGFISPPEEIPTKDTVMQSLNISVEEEKRTSQYFRCLLESETNRLSDQCNIWEDIIITENPPEEAKAFIEQAIGQTKLLLRSKFKQFEGLVVQCEEGAGGHLVTCKDLQGFWDMMGVTVKNCESRFQKVEELKARGWKEEEEMEKIRLRKVSAKISKLKNKSPKKSPKKKSPIKKAPAKSSLRAMILAARQKKKELEKNLEDKPSDEKIAEIWTNVVKDSPAKVQNTKRKTSVTPRSQTAKERRISFPHAAMAISKRCKTPEDNIPESKITLATQHEIDSNTDSEIEIIKVQVHLDESISYINSKQTPGKSILKRIKMEVSAEESDNSRLTKSTQKVNFNDNVELKEVEVDEEERNKLSLAAALARIDSMDFDQEIVPEVSIRAEKKLNFEDDSFNESKNASLIEDVFFNDEEQTHKTLIVPDLNFIPPTPKSPQVNKKNIKNNLVENVEVEEEVTFTKALRNRTITGNLTPRSAKKLKENSESAKKGKSPSRRNNNSFHHEEESTKISEENLSLNDRNSDKMNLSGTLNQSLRSSRKTPKLREERIQDETVSELKKLEILSPPKEVRTLRQRTPKQKEEAKVFEKQESGEKKKSNSAVKMAKMAIRSTLLRKMMKSPMSASKKKDILNASEDMEIESDAESSFSDKPMTQNRKGSSKKIKTPKARKQKKENETKVEENILKEKFQKMQLDESNSEKSSALTKLLATPHDLSQEKSPKQRRQNTKVGNESLLKEQIEQESFESNVENLLKENTDKNENAQEMENSTIENILDPLQVKNFLKLSNSTRQRNNEKVLNNKNINHKNSKDLNLSLQETKKSKHRTPRRSSKIPENELQVEKENAIPENSSPKESPKHSETQSKRKSIRRTMSCHVEECQTDFASTPQQIRRSKSFGLAKTASGR